MMNEIVSKLVFRARRMLAGFKMSLQTGTILANLRAAAPYALMELVLPGGSVMALLLWLYRRQRKAAVFVICRAARVRYRTDDGIRPC